MGDLVDECVVEMRKMFVARVLRSADERLAPVSAVSAGSWCRCS